MAELKDTFQTITGWLKELFEFGVAIILVFVVIEILFPGTTPIIENIGLIVGRFADKGIVGLIALLVFLLIYKK